MATTDTTTTSDAATSRTPEPDARPWEEQLIADMRAHGGRPSGGPLAGQPLLLMWSTGARTGLERRSILTYSRDGDDYIVAGSFSGADVDPAWISNVRKDPQVRLEIDGETCDAIATIVPAAERDRLWKAHVATLPWFADYEHKTSRVIPVVRLSRRA